jgi:iron(III) transport system substrate-binding protein
MGEDAAFDYLKKLHKNVTQYTRSGPAQARRAWPRARSASA